MSGEIMDIGTGFDTAASSDIPFATTTKLTVQMVFHIKLLYI